MNADTYKRDLEQAVQDFAGLTKRDLERIAIYSPEPSERDAARLELSRRNAEAA